jgi:hypothetical protein
LKERDKEFEEKLKKIQEEFAKEKDAMRKELLRNQAMEM